MEEEEVIGSGMAVRHATVPQYRRHNATVETVST
jgi:hypothetical protein